MKKREKERASKKLERRNEREVNKLVMRTGLKGSAKGMAAQYGKGLLDGMHIAYLAVVSRLLRAGNTRDEITSFMSDMLERSEISELLDEAMEENGTRSV